MFGITENPLCVDDNLWVGKLVGKSPLGSNSLLPNANPPPPLLPLSTLLCQPLLANPPLPTPPCQPPPCQHHFANPALPTPPFQHRLANPALVNQAEKGNKKKITKGCKQNKEKRKTTLSPLLPPLKWVPTSPTAVNKLIFFFFPKKSERHWRPPKRVKQSTQRFFRKRKKGNTKGNTHRKKKVGAAVGRYGLQEPCGFVRLVVAFSVRTARSPPCQPLANRQPPTANRQPPTANRQPPTANRQPPTANRQPPTANRQPPTALPTLAVPTAPPPHHHRTVCVSCLVIVETCDLMLFKRLL